MTFIVVVKLAGPFAFLPFALVAAPSGWYVCLRRKLAAWPRGRLLSAGKARLNCNDGCTT